ncbi:hypothetical_protein [Leishmania major strain Friedlin]|nr:hypothetical_protein [Leishmania major strain Friedlin]
MSNLGGQARVNLHRSPSRREGSRFAHRSQPPYPANDRLGPIETACKTPMQKHEEDYRSSAAARSAHKLNKQLFGRLPDLEEGHWQPMAPDCKRERRLRSTDELARHRVSAQLRVQR